MAEAERLALVALGSNLGSTLGEPLEHLRRAALELSDLGALRGRSSLYATAPVGGPAGQADYLNAVVALEPFLPYAEPAALLAALLALERRHGRLRRERWGARTLDLDLLAHGDRTLRQPGLALPHPRMMERAFVLAPLCELLPGWRHPESGASACEALERLPRADVRRTGLTWESGS